MNDIISLEKTIVRELSCRLCLCTDVAKLRPLSVETKRKLKRLFNILVRADDFLPKAICHDCLQQVQAMHLYSVKVERTQKFLDFHKTKSLEEKSNVDPKINNNRQIALSDQNIQDIKIHNKAPLTTPTSEHQGDTKFKNAKPIKKRSPFILKYMESMTLEEFAKEERVDRLLLNSAGGTKKSAPKPSNKKDLAEKDAKNSELENSVLDPVVIIDGRPAKQGTALDKQITLFYKMECCICHEKGFHFRSLMKHYKERHGVPGYVSCCDKKFHYFYPKKIIEHMAYHLQPEIFMCHSCHQNFLTSQELMDHQSNGGHLEGKILCPRCSERYPTYLELGRHIVTHRCDKRECDYCAKQLKHNRRKKTINHMEDVVLCSHCTRTMRNIEKQEKEAKEKVKLKNNALHKHQKFRQAMGLSADEDESTD